ncbi:hypothetical protein AVEN_119985-1, partial [Araneus ventricosus]
SLARAADKTPRRDSHSKGDLNVDQYSIQARSLYSLSDKPGRHKELSITVKRISSPNRDIEKRIAFSGIFNCRQVANMIAKFVDKVRGPDLAAANHSILTPVKFFSQPYD